jgi:hypothetical protein
VLTKKNTASIFGSVGSSNPIWKKDDVDDGKLKSLKDIVLHAKSETFTATTKTNADGTYEFNDLPNGKYTVVPEITSGLDYNHEYPEWYEADVSDGACKKVSFRVEPATRIRGHVTLPSGFNDSIEVVAIPTSMTKLNQFSGKWDFTEKDGGYDLWPLPEGDYYVGVNINSSPKADSPFPPTYYPGVTKKSDAAIVHVATGEIKELNFTLKTLATPRMVRFKAIGLDGKPLRAIYVQLEDLRHPGDAASYVNVDLDENGAGVMTIYAGYSYHLHGSHWMSYMNDWCAKPVVIQAGTGDVETKFVMDRKAQNCDIYEIDGLKR